MKPIIYLITFLIVFLSCNNGNERDIAVLDNTEIHFGEKIITSKTLIDGTTLPEHHQYRHT